MNWFFESLSKDDPSTSCEALRNAGFYYLLFFLIHPYEDGNKRTSAYIIQSRIHFPLGTKWNSFPSNKKKMEYEVAHVGEEHINWDALIFNLQTFKFRFQKFYKFFLEAILD
jgi:hypothetical protein